MQFVNDPTEFPPVGAPAGVLVGPRTQSGEAFLWEPGGDAEAVVRLFGEHQLVNVGGQVYQRQADGTLTPASFLTSKVVIVKPPAGDTFYMQIETATRTFARVDGRSAASEVGDPGASEAGEGERAVSDVAAAEPPKRGPGRPKGSTNKKPPSTEV